MASESLTLGTTVGFKNIGNDEPNQNDGRWMADEELIKVGRGEYDREGYN